MIDHPRRVHDNRSVTEIPSPEILDNWEAAGISESNNQGETSRSYIRFKIYSRGPLGIHRNHQQEGDDEKALPYELIPAHTITPALPDHPSFTTLHARNVSSHRLIYNLLASCNPDRNGHC